LRTVNETDVGKWLAQYGRAWETRDPDEAAALFSHDVRYFETPFAAPAEGRNGVREYWAHATRRQTDVTFSYELVSVFGQRAVARWSAQFTRVSSGVTAELDGVALLDFDEEGLCRELREWWHIVETEPGDR
jgi:nuclear transport factor 2 (NTF2) superfamily protein